MLCDNCGKEIADNLKFCTGCGARVGTAAVGTVTGQPGILGKLVDGLSKRVATVGVDSKAFVGKTTINNIITKLENEKKQFAETLGMRVYELQMAGSEISKGDVENFVNEISKRIHLITFQQEQLKLLEAVTDDGRSGNTHLPICKCGHMNEQGSRFCLKCGSGL